MLESELMEHIQKIRNENGFINYVGVEYGEFHEGYATGKLKLRPQLRNPFGSVHGGCIFTLADTIGGTAAMTRGSYVTTVSASIQYLYPAKDTEYLTAEAEEVKNGRTISVYDVWIRDDKQNHIAKVTLSYYKLGPIESENI